MPLELNTDTGAEPSSQTATQSSDINVRHLRQIVLWPLQIMPGPDGTSVKAEALLQQLAGDTWSLVEDEFGNPEVPFQERHYREFVSFLPHVQRFLYGDAAGPTRQLSDSDLALRIYRRKDIAAVRLDLRPGLAPVTCRVTHLDLHFFYDVDAIILACEIAADDVPLATAKEIMYRFGRAYPPGWTAQGVPLHCPISAEWLSADGRVLATSDYGDRDGYLAFVGERRAPRIASHWEFALAPFASFATDSRPSLRFRQIEYYRMPVMTFIAVDDLSRLDRDDFIRLTFAAPMGVRGEAPYSARILQDFENKHCYDRFFDEHRSSASLNTRFLTCGHAFTIVASGSDELLLDNERGLLSQFRHQYFLLFLISHFHKASMLMLSDRLVAVIKRLEIGDVRSVASFRKGIYRLQEAFMRFTQRYWFTDISDQVQTRDLFRLQLAHLGNDVLYRDLRHEMFDTVQYLDSDMLRRQSGSMHRLTTITILGLIGTTVTGFLGMNLISEAEAPMHLKVLYFVAVTAAVAAITAITVALSGSLTRWLDRISGERS